MTAQLSQKTQISRNRFLKSQSRQSKSSDPEIVQFLSSLRLFASLPKGELETLSCSCRFASLSPREYITIEGDEKPFGFIVADGRLAMMKTSMDGKDLVVELLAPGDIFGLLIGMQRSNMAQLSAVAQTKAKVLWVPMKQFLALLESYPEMSREAIADLLDSLQASYRIARGLAHDRVETRIAAILSSMALKFPRISETQQEAVINITRQQLADIAGTSSETAIRITREMQRNGIIAMEHPGLIEIVDLRGLRLISEG